MYSELASQISWCLCIQYSDVLDCRQLLLMMLLAGWSVGQEVSEDISVLPPDSWRSDQGRVCWVVVETVPARCTDCVTGQLRDSGDCHVRVHVTGETVTQVRPLRLSYMSRTSSCHRWDCYAGETITFELHVTYEFMSQVRLRPLRLSYMSHMRPLRLSSHMSQVSYMSQVRPLLTAITKLPSFLKHVATVPCETFMCKSHRDLELS